MMLLLASVVILATTNGRLLKQQSAGFAAVNSNCEGPLCSVFSQTDTGANSTSSFGSGFGTSFGEGSQLAAAITAASNPEALGAGGSIAGTQGPGAAGVSSFTGTDGQFAAQTNVAASFGLDGTIAGTGGFVANDESAAGGISLASTDGPGISVATNSNLVTPGGALASSSAAAQGVGGASVFSGSGATN